MTADTPAKPAQHGLTLADIPLPVPCTREVYEQIYAKSILSPLSSKRTYWGEELLLEALDDGAVWKRIDMRANTQSSLEYHVTKQEIYFLVSGNLDIGIRIGRAQNHIIHMTQGQSFVIPAGLMHMRIARSDLVLVEWALHDNPKDTHIVEDGSFYKHVCAS